MQAFCHERVSTHSRLKAAGTPHTIARTIAVVSTHSRPKAAGSRIRPSEPAARVSTHSRPKAAGWPTASSSPTNTSFNTQPPEGGWEADRSDWHPPYVSTHSRPKAAGARRFNGGLFLLVSTHSRPKAAGAISMIAHTDRQFQHTAARRRLGLQSTKTSPRRGFNTQPPEGGWSIATFAATCPFCFNTQPPEGGWIGGSSD